MKNKRKLTRFFQLLTVVIFVFSIIIMGFAFIFCEKTGYSEIEKRKLTAFPKFNSKTLFSGEFTDNLTKYVSDNFAFRDSLVNLSFKLEDMRGIRIDGIKIYDNGTSLNDVDKIISIDTPILPVKSHKKSKTTNLLGEEVKAVINFEDLLENSDEYNELSPQDIKGEKRGALFIVGDTALEIFYGNEKVSTDYANIVNAFKSAVNPDVNVYNLLIPTHFEFGLPKKYKDEVGRPQKPFIDSVYSKLDASVLKVDAYSEIQKAFNKKEYLYFRTDHHWTSLGAYKAYSAFAKKAGFEPTPLSEFEHKKIDKFLGTFYSSTYDKNLASNPDYVEYFVPNIPYTVTNYHENGVDTYEGTLLYQAIKSDSAGYLVFMGGDIPLSVIETQNNTGRNLLIFKESYGNAFVPFIVGNFDKIFVADIRKFPFNAIDFTSQNSVTDVLFINSILTACTPPRIQNYINLLS